MKSKIQNPIKRKALIFIITITIIMLMILSAILSNYKKGKLVVGKLSNNKMSTTTVISNQLGTSDEQTKFYNTNVIVNPQPLDTNIRKVELQKKDSYGNWITYVDTNGDAYKYQLGDIDNNGTIDEYDAAYIWGYLAGEKELTSIQQLAADINGDGVIDSLDYQIILYIFGRYTIEGTEIILPYLIGNPGIETSYDTIPSDRSNTSRFCYKKCRFSNS